MFFAGDWDAVVVPVAEFFASAEVRQNAVLAYGPPHLLRAAWLAGVQDYLREPWEPEELFLRLKGPRPPVVEWTWATRAWRLEARQLTCGNQSCHLSPTEAELLRLLVLRRGMAVSRGVLAWAASCSTGRVVDTLVARLRSKLQILGGVNDDPIAGVRGVGYRLP